MRKVLLFSVLMLLLTLPYASNSQVTQEWVRKFIGQGLDHAAGIATDNSGNIYILGNNNWTFPNADLYLVQYNSAGTQTGGVFYNSPYNNSDNAKTIATDARGNIYVAAKVTVNSSTSDIAVIKYNSSMIQQWATIFNTPENYIDDVNAMAIDPAGNVYLTGSIVKGAFEYDYLTVKISATGSVLWHTTYNGTADGIDIANDIAVDAVGNVFVTGSSSGFSRGTRGRGRLFFTLTTSYDVVTIKYDANGVQQWSQRYNRGGQNDAGNSVALDGAGNVFVTGYATTNGNRDCVTIKYTNDGVFQWLQLYNGTANGADEANSIAIDAAGNAIISGYTNSSLTNSDMLAVKYDNAGVLQWVGTYSAASNTFEQSSAMVLDMFGNTYLTGSTSVPGLVNSDYLTVKFNSSGSVGWAARYNGPENGNDYATSIAVVNPGFDAFANATIYVFGSSNNDVVTIKYSQPTDVIFLGPQRNQISESDAGKFKSYAFPNPVRTYTNVFFQLPADGNVIVSVYDELGRKLSTATNGFYKKGSYSTKLNVASLSNGEYYYRVVYTSGGKQMVQTNKFILRR
jgi:hypothetical protein